MVEFREALCDVRKAHRLIFSYQTRILDLIQFISSKLDLSVYAGGKHFSDPIAQRKRGEEGYFSIHANMWAWDFLYSYQFEFYLGTYDMEDGSEFAMSIVHYADTGYYDVEESSRTNIDSFATEESSQSKLLFYIETKAKKAKNWIWNIKELAATKEYACAKHTNTIIDDKKGHVQVLYSFPIERFYDEHSTIDAIKEFVDFCKKNNVIEFSIY